MRRGPRPESGLRRCAVCRETKPLTDFYRDSKRGWSHRCKTCSRERRRRAYHADPETARAKTRDWYERNKATRRAFGASDACRFWAKVDKRGAGECWTWLGSRVPSGYGQFAVGAHGYRAHRVAYELTHGPLEPGESLAHACGDRACCNPHHIVVGYDGKGLSPEQRFWRNVRRTDGCWEWLGSTDAEGYGQIKVDGRQMRAGRFAHQLLCAAVPRDHVLFVSCDNPSCVRPDHLQPVPSTALAGMRERLLPARCARGHAYAPNAPRRRDGSRRCLACERLHASGRRALKRGCWIEEVDPLVVLQLTDGRCGICGEGVDPEDFDIDHIVPLSRGGEHSYANTQPTHARCNRRKNNKLPGEDKPLRRATRRRAELSA